MILDNQPQLVEELVAKLKATDEQLQREIVARRQAEAEQQRLLAAEHEQRLLAETLGEVFLALTAQTSHEAVLDEILRQVQRLVSYSAANIMLLEGDILHVARAQGYEAYSSAHWLSNLRQPLHEFPLDSQVVQTRQPLLIPDTSQNSQWVTLSESAWIQSFMVTPICLHDRVLGLLHLDSDTPGKFSPTDLTRLQPLTHAAAIALENARLYDQARQELAERLQAEEGLETSEAKFRTLAETTSAAIFIYQNNGIRYVNRAAEIITGYIQAELLTLNFEEQVIHPSFRGFIRRRGVIRQNPTRSQVKILTKQGQERWLDITRGIIEYQGSQAILGTAFDITTHKQVEEALRESEASLAEREARLLGEMQSVLVITRALVTEVDLNHLMELIITQAEHLTNADGVAVLLLNEDGPYLEVATISKAGLQTKVGSLFPLEGSLVELAITSRQVQIRNYTPNDERTASIQSLLQSDQAHSLLCAPLVIQNEDLGALLIWSKREQIFTAYESRLMSLFADQAALALDNARLQARNRQLAIEQERHRLARELHDSVTQSLYSIGLAAQTSLRLLGKEVNSPIREPIGYIHTLSQTALTEMREQLYHLHPTILNEDLVEALTQHCNILHKQYALAIDIQANLPMPLSIEQRDALYYISREALWNTVRHAKATRVRLVLAKDYDHIVLIIEDNGRGFDPSIFVQGNTMGLRNMVERATMLGGTLEAQSTAEQGTCLTLRIPL